MSLSKNHVQQNRVSSSALCEVLNYLEAIENRHNFYIYILLLIFLMDGHLGNEMMHLLRLSIVLESFSTLHVVLEIVNPHPANCDSLMQFGKKVPRLQ